ncbi:hypothetical protein V6N11_044892 [Hibiscus sabdariffa]|uniref:Uncharacterized protein n=1 Tax=Hibiscus sabdariffa TaxID=183260 RepID=A0ABR2PU71_9ROSI
MHLGAPEAFQESNFAGSGGLSSQHIRQHEILCYFSPLTTTPYVIVCPPYVALSPPLCLSSSHEQDLTFRS